MVYDFTAFVDNGFSYNQMSMFPDFVQPTDADQDFYFDDIRFLDAVAGTTDPVLLPQNAPEFEHDSVFLQQDENIDTTQVIWNASATDADGDDVTYSLGGSDADDFNIDVLTGEVSFADSPDYESGVTDYDFTVTASDGELTADQALSVQILNVVEQYTLDSADLVSGGDFTGEADDDLMDGRGLTSALALSGGGGTDVLYGGDAGDVLDGGEGNDQLSGGGGNDVLIAGTGVDRIDGGDGIDTVVLGSDSESMVSVNLAREWQYSGDGWNQIVNVENVVTGGGADIIKGNDVGNVVESGAGNDWLYGNGGDDVLLGGEGIDRLFGGDGNDTVLYDTDEDLVIDLNSEWQLGNDGTAEGIDKLIDIENVTTGSGNDVLVGNDGDNVLIGGDGDDTLTGGDGADVFRFYSSEGPSTDVITDFSDGDSIELIDDTTGAVAQAQITTDADGSTVTWDELTIVLDVTVDYDDINPIVS
jgi:Ca2+-binding RTX toxin-like protein